MSESTASILNTYFDAVRRRRSHLEMKIEILQSISRSDTPVVRSRINHETMLPWKVVERELSLLQKQGLVRTDIDPELHFNDDSSYYALKQPEVFTGRKRRKKAYLLTERGKSVLCKYTAIQQSFASILLEDLKIEDEQKVPDQEVRIAAPRQTIVVK